MAIFEPRMTREHKATLRHRSSEIAKVNSKFSGNTTDQVGNPAILIRVQQAEPAPSSEYQSWFDGAWRGRKSPIIDGEKLRRAVRMIRNGYSVSDCERSLGGGLRHWIKILPPGLRP